MFICPKGLVVDRSSIGRFARRLFPRMRAKRIFRIILALVPVGTADGYRDMQRQSPPMGWCDKLEISRSASPPPDDKGSVPQLG